MSGFKTGEIIRCIILMACLSLLTGCSTNSSASGSINKSSPTDLQIYKSADASVISTSNTESASTGTNTFTDYSTLSPEPTAEKTTEDSTPSPDITATPVPIPTQDLITFQVSSAIASVSPESGPSVCNKQTSFEFIFSGTITVTAAGTVEYKWVQSNGVEYAGTLTFSSAGTQSVPDNSWIVYGGSLFTGWGKIVVTSPNSISSNQANFTRLYCPVF